MGRHQPGVEHLVGEGGVRLPVRISGQLHERRTGDDVRAIGHGRAVWDLGRAEQVERGGDDIKHGILSIIHHTHQDKRRRAEPRSAKANSMQIHGYRSLLR